MKSSFLDPFRRLLPSAPALAPAHPGGESAPAHFASSGGGGGGRFDDPENDYFDDPAPTEAEDSARPPRRAEQQATAARRRTVQSEPDDRYWTDYLRIALPVIGLLLVIAVFWFWAQRLIDDDTSTDLTPTEPGLAELADTATEPPAEAPGTPAQADTSGDAGPAAQPTTDPGAQPTTEPAAEPTTDPAAENPDDGGGDAGDVTNALLDSLDDSEGGGEIAVDSRVVVSAEADTLNLRSDPTAAEENIVTTLTAGTEMDVLSGPEEAEGITWWNVVTVPGGETGWVSAEFIEPAG